MKRADALLAAPTTALECWNWLPREELTRLAMLAFEMARRGCEPGHGEPFVQDGAPWCGRDSFTAELLDNLALLVGRYSVEVGAASCFEGSDRLLLVLHDARKGSPTEGVTMRLMLGDGNNRLIRIPPGIAHGCTNLGDKSATIIYFVDVQFSIEPDECDEGRLPWDFCGAEIWEMVKG